MKSELVDITAIMVNYNTAHLLDEAIGALRVSAVGRRLQVTIVDNASRDNSLQILRERFSDCDLIENPANVGFGRANNQALKLASGRYVLLLNTDAFVAPDTLSKTLAYMDANPQCGVLGVRLVGRDGSLQPSCRYFPTPWNVFLARTGLARLFPRVRMVDDMGWDHVSVRECDWVPGCYYLVRKAVLDVVGLFDPRYFLYCEEVDHCRAVKAAGWTVVYYPHTTVVHIGGESAQSDSALTTAGRQISALQVESELLYFRKHHGLAGLCLAMVLEHVAAVVLGLKRLLKYADLRGTWLPFKNVATTWRLLRATAWATRPTR
jgi:GT2 family glycosyltransferase